MLSPKNSVNKQSQATPPPAAPSHVSPRKLHKVLRAVDRVARAWERRGARFWPHPKATHARPLDMPGGRENLVRAIALAPELPPKAWATAAAGWAWPMFPRGSDTMDPTPAEKGGRPNLGLSHPVALMRFAAVSARHIDRASTRPRALRAAEQILAMLDREVRA